MDFSVHRFESVSSTNDVAARMADDGAPEGTVVIAGEQTKGRGRHGRSWSSPLGTGLYLSVVLRPDVPFERLWQMAFVASVGVAQAVERVSGIPVRIKWPNDVLLNGRKVCGILIEARKAGRPLSPSPPPPVILGVGINVNTPEFPDEIAGKATSIALELGRPIEMGQMEDALLAALDEQYSRYLADGFPRILEAWKSLDCTVGSRVTAGTPDETLEGIALGVDGDGNLIVQSADGIAHLVTAGEVVVGRDG